MAATSGLPAPGGRPATEVTPPIAGELAAGIARARAAGRWPPRVLHIGNIANNAYLNARILNQAGVPSDVLVYDYYHVMGCPEWEEADIVDLPEQFDENRLDWSALTIRDFERPVWFSQGPFRWATRYLESRAAGRTWDAALHWRLLAFYRWSHARPRLEVVLQKLVVLRYKLIVWTAVVRSLASKGWYYAKLPVRRLWHEARRWTTLVCLLGKRCATEPPGDLARRLLARIRPQVVPAGAGLSAAADLEAGSAGPGVALAIAATPQGEPCETGRAAPGGSDPPGSPSPLPQVGALPLVDPLITRFAQLFPERTDQLTAEDLIPYRGAAASFKSLLDHYDIVVGYATDPVWPMVAEHPCYMAFEHGTIRAIPFENSAQGRLTALGYRTARCSFITNCDEIRAIEKLQLDNATFVPHPMNDRLLAEADGSSIRKDLEARFGADFVVFHPARQHWETARNPSLEKGNDLFLRAFARFVREVDPRALLVAVRWGKSLADTDRLLAEEGIAGRVHWIRPVPNRAMLRWVAASDVVADQFWLGCFGGITPKAYGMGKPVVIYLEAEIHDWCFPYMPPHIEERTPEAIFDFIAGLYRDPAHLARVSAVSRDWYVKYHSEASIRDRFVKALLERWALPATGALAAPAGRPS